VLSLASGVSSKTALCSFAPIDIKALGAAPFEAEALEELYEKLTRETFPVHHIPILKFLL
jgi:hypothetical protein